MVIIGKKVSSEVVAKTQITEDTLILNKVILAGIKRYIHVEGEDPNTVIREYIQANDIMQNAVELLGIADDSKVKDWDDSTAAGYQVTVAGGSSIAETDLFKWDLGGVYDILLHTGTRSKAGATGLTVIIRVYYSEDDITYTLFDENSATGVEQDSWKARKVRARYIKVTYEVSNTSTVTYNPVITIYTVEALPLDNTLCNAYIQVDPDTLSVKHKVTVQNQKVSVVISTTNCNYRIVDIEDLMEDYTEVNEV